jgi:long-chain acyl-CoA synthetase
VRRCVIAGEPFSLANAQLTPTLKIRRHAIREAYHTEFEMLYDGKGMAA